MYRTLLGICAVFAVSLGLVGLTFSSATQTAADFTFINGTEPKTLDPQKMTGQPEGRIADALFEGLTRRNAKTMRPEPGVAESWEISPDGRRYTFTLRPDARWSDGRRVTAGDFAYAWRRLQDPATAAEYAYILHMIRYAEAFNSYGAHADALAGPVASQLEALRESSQADVSGEAWKAFLSETRLNERVKGSPEPLLADLLSRRGAIEAAELAELAQALAREAERRAALQAEASRRFGVDAGVFAVDDHTLVVELASPTPYFLDLVGFYPAHPTPRWVVEAPGNENDWFMPEKIVGNGAYVFETWRVNDRIRLRRSPTYWDHGSVALDRIDVLPTENATTSLNLYLTGAVDWLPSNYPSDLVDQLRVRPDFYTGPGLAVYYYRINVEAPGLDDRRVREAINLAIDRDLIVNEVLGLGQLPATHVVPPGMAGYDAPVSALRHDPEAARALLAEAGYPGGVGLPDIGILYNTHDTHKKIAEVIADQLRRELGMQVRAYNQEWQSYLATTRGRDYTLARAGWIGDYEDPNTFLDLWVSEGGNNQTGWSHALYDRLIAAAADVEAFVRSSSVELEGLSRGDDVARAVEAVRREADDAKRRRLAARLRMLLLAEAEHIIVAQEFPLIPIYFYVVKGLVSPEVEGFHTVLELEDGSRGYNLQDLHPLRALRKRVKASDEDAS